MKKKTSVNLPVELTDRIKEMADKHGMAIYDKCSINQMITILLALGIETYNKRMK